MPAECFIPVRDEHEVDSSIGAFFDSHGIWVVYQTLEMSASTGFEDRQDIAVTCPQHHTRLHREKGRDGRGISFTQLTTCRNWQSWQDQRPDHASISPAHDLSHLDSSGSAD